MAGRDEEKLRALLADVTVDDAGLLALLGDLRGNDPKAGLTDPDEVPEPAAEPYIKPGELYRLGDHRILCGDATNADDVARLLDGAAPTLLATDPPYGVQLDQTWRDGVYNGPRKRVHGWGVVAGAEKPYMMRDAAAGQPDGEDTARASRGHHTPGHRNTSISMDTRADWSEAFALVPSLQVGYVWYASIHTLEVLQGLLGIGFELAGQVIWDKGLFSVGRSWYHWAHEPCVVVRKPGVPHLFIGERDQATIWRAPSPKRIGGGSQGAQGGPPDPEAGAPLRDPDPQPPAVGRGRLRAVLRFGHDPDGSRDPRPALLRDGDRPQVRPGRGRALAGLHREVGRRSASVGRRGPAPTPGGPGRASGAQPMLARAAGHVRGRDPRPRARPVGLSVARTGGCWSGRSVGWGDMGHDVHTTPPHAGIPGVERVRPRSEARSQAPPEAAIVTSTAGTDRRRPQPRSAAFSGVQPCSAAFGRVRPRPPCRDEPAPIATSAAASLSPGAGP